MVIMPTGWLAIFVSLGWLFRAVMHFIYLLFFVLIIKLVQGANKLVVDLGHVHIMTNMVMAAKESCKMATILQLIG